MTGPITLRAEAPDGTVKTTVGADTAAKGSTLTGSFPHASIALSRGEWATLDDALDRRNDHLIIEDPSDGSDWAGGRFDGAGDGGGGGGQIRGATVQGGAGTRTIRIASFALDFVDAEPSSPESVYQNVADSTIVQDVVDAVPTVSTGTVETIASALSMTFSNADRAKQLQDIVEAAGGEIRWHPDATLDYVGRVGADRNLTLSPSNQNVIGQPEITEESRDNVTHIKGFGAQQGSNQVTATAVADSYAGGRKIWRKYENKDVIEQSRLQSIIDRQVTEYDGEPTRLDIRATVVDEQLSLGDRVTVRLPDDGIDRMLRIIELAERLTKRGREYVALLSNRLATRGDPAGTQTDLQRFNRGFQGFVDRDNFRAVGRQPISASYNAVGEYQYPDDVVREERAEITVVSLPYRAYVSPAGHTHDVSVTHPQHSHGVSVSHPKHTHDVSATSGSSTSPSTTDFPNNDGGVVTVSATSGSDVDTYTVGNPTFLVSSLINVRNASSGQRSLEISLNNRTTGESGIVDTNPIEMAADETVVVSGIVPGNVNGDDLAWNVYNISGSDASVDFETHYLEMGRHDHDISTTSSAELGTTSTETSDASLGATESTTTGSTAAFEPGLNEFAGETASNVDVLVGGSEVASNIGSGEFRTTVDISGEFSPGTNDIEIASDSLGFVTAIVQTELFRRGQSN
ncbi:hypothetical protein [Halostella pelagica]|uniref:hypothetical protein n=1 Tax=Halostella pelagica TaxID=2583824 RepID=UPI0010805A4E|nr:hypothetical protein [Halostella pelagica]